MKLAKKLTAKALQKKGNNCNIICGYVSGSYTKHDKCVLFAETFVVAQNEKPVSNTNPFQNPCKPVVST